MEDNIIDFILPKLNMVDHTIFNPVIKKSIDHFNLEKISGQKTIKDAIYVAGKLGLIEFSGNTRSGGKLTVNGYYIVKNGGYLNYLSKGREKDKISTHNYFNVGQVIQDSRFSNSQAINNEKDIPAKKEGISSHAKIWELAINNKLISSIIFAILVGIAGYLGFR